MGDPYPIVKGFLSVVGKTIKGIGVSPHSVRYAASKILRDDFARYAQELHPPATGGQFWRLGDWDVDRTCLTGRQAYEDGKRLGWHMPVREVLLHIMSCERECPTLLPVLRQFFAMSPEYQVRAA